MKTRDHIDMEEDMGEDIEEMNYCLRQCELQKAPCLLTLFKKTPLFASNDLCEVIKHGKSLGYELSPTIRQINFSGYGYAGCLDMFSDLDSLNIVSFIYVTQGKFRLYKSEDL